jgi:hypothetical protein
MPKDEAPQYDPIEPDFAPSSICSEIFVRAYAEPQLARGRNAPESWQRRTRPESWFEGEFIVIDTETVNHNLIFGAYERYHKRKLIESAVFCRDDLPMTDPDGFARLRAFCRRRSLRLYLLANVFSAHIWRLRRKGGTLCFFNASYDLSRLASSWRPATASRRRGARFVNGFEFVRRFITSKDRHGKPLIGADGTLLSRTIERPFVRIRRDDRHHVRYDIAAANVLDLATLTHALTDQTYSLPYACEAFGIEFEDRPGEHDGTITEENVAGCLYDVAKTSKLLFAVGREYDRHPIDLPPWHAQSAASLAKAYLRAWGVVPRSIVQPDFSKEHQGYAAVAYFGGRVEARVVREPVPCTYMRLSAQAPYWRALDECGGKIVPDMVFDLKRKRWQRAGEFADVPAKLMRANPRRPQTGRADGNLDRITDMMRPALSDPDLTTGHVLAFFCTHERPSMPAARKAAASEVPESDGDPASHRLVTIGPLTSVEPLWFAGPDLAAAAIVGTGRSRIVRAWRLRPEGVQSTLQPVKFRGEDLIDPATCNPFQRLIELRKRKSGNKFDDDLRSTGYKTIANSGAYGCFVETTPEDIDPDGPPPSTRVTVRGLRTFEAVVERPEWHSPLCSFPIASFVTAGARLLLSVAEHLVREAEGEVCYDDTDSLMVITRKDGGFVPCEGGPYRLQDGRRAVRALSWAQLDRILDDLAALKVYDPAIVLGSSFKIEDENFDPAGHRRELWFYGTREKSYALYGVDDGGELGLAKQSAHTIGQYRSPYPRDRERRWIAEAWIRTIREALGQSVEPPWWFELPATSQLTLTTWNLTKHYRRTSDPFDFLAVAQVAYPGMLRCCEAPRPSCLLFKNLAAWAEQSWQCLSCGTAIEPYLADTELPIFKMYRRVVANLAQSIELKRLPASGAEPTPETMRGLTIPRPVHATLISHLGKEVIVDPTDTSEDLTAEELNATEPVIYLDEDTRIDDLRAGVRAAGVKRVARAAVGVSLSTIQRFVNHGTKLHPSKVARIEAALAALVGPRPTPS